MSFVILSWRVTEGSETLSSGKRQSHPLMRLTCLTNNDNIPYRIAKTDMSRAKEFSSLLAVTGENSALY